MIKYSFCTFLVSLDLHQRVKFKDHLMEWAGFSEADRPKRWKHLLQYSDIDYEGYCERLEQDNEGDFDNIIGDVSRTYNGNTLFWSKVSRESMIRILKIFVIYEKGVYVQGMNVVLAPFLYVFNEHEAFALFKNFVSSVCPRYFEYNMSGVYDGILLFEQCIQALDSELHRTLVSKLTSFQVFSFPAILTFFASMEPLSELLLIWDFLFEFGAWNVVLLMCCYVISLKEIILREPSSSA